MLGAREWLRRSLSWPTHPRPSEKGRFLQHANAVADDALPRREADPHFRLLAVAAAERDRRDARGVGRGDHEDRRLAPNPGQGAVRHEQRAALVRSENTSLD